MEAGREAWGPWSRSANVSILLSRWPAQPYSMGTSGFSWCEGLSPSPARPRVQGQGWLLRENRTGPRRLPHTHAALLLLWAAGPGWPWVPASHYPRGSHCHLAMGPCPPPLCTSPLGPSAGRAGLAGSWKGGVQGQASAGKDTGKVTSVGWGLWGGHCAACGVRYLDLLLHLKAKHGA